MAPDRPKHYPSYPPTSRASDPPPRRFRSVWLAVVLIGMVAGILGALRFGPRFRILLQNECTSRRIISMLAQPGAAAVSGGASDPSLLDTRFDRFEQSAFSSIPDAAHWLRSRNADLVVLLVPTRDYMDDPSRLRENSLAIAKLRSLKVECRDLTPIFRKALEAPTSVDPFLDDAHLSSDGCTLVREYLKTDPTLTSAGNIALAGDCTVEGVAWGGSDSLSGRLGGLFGLHPPFDLIYREGAAHSVAATFSLQPDDYWAHHPRLVWVLHDHYIRASSPRRPFLPPESAASSPTLSGTCRVKTVSVSRYDPNLPRSSPYPDALVAHLYEDLDTRARFVGVHRLMRQRHLEDGYCILPGDELRMTARDWSSAQRAEPELSRLQLIDDVSDPSLPILWVLAWAKEWSVPRLPD